jgi:hypothetical protein
MSARKEFTCELATLHDGFAQKSRPWTLLGFLSNPFGVSEYYLFHQHVAKEYQRVCDKPHYFKAEHVERFSSIIDDKMRVRDFKNPPSI